MRTIYLLRHAKSSWDDPSLADHDRPLAPRGVKAAPVMADYLREHEIAPELVLCSTATRARQTWDALASSITPSPEVHFDRAVYDAAAGDLLSILQALPEACQSVMVIGHNPTLEDLTNQLNKARHTDAAQRLAEKFPTAALAELKSDAVSWKDLAPGSATLVRFVKPKELV